MPLIEGFRVTNYRALRNVTLGKVSHQDSAEPLTPFTVVIGKNGVGKSTLFDAFGFLADCLNHDVESACNMRGRGGFERLLSKEGDHFISFDLRYREAPELRPIIYALTIRLDDRGIPWVSSEAMRQVEEDGTQGSLRPIFMLEQGRGSVWKGEDSLGDIELIGASHDTEDPDMEGFELTDPQRLAIATLGTLREHPRIQRLRDFLKGWYLSYFYPDAARTKPIAGPQRHLNERGDNIGNVVQYMEREHKDRFELILKKIATKIPGIKSITTTETEDKRLLLRFNDGAFKDPFLSEQMSDGTLKMFAYLLLLEDPDPPPFICIEEPENGLYHKLLDSLATEFRQHATGGMNAPQIFVTTHQPYFVDALAPREVWILEKNADGFSEIRRASDLEQVRNLVEEGLPLGGLWYSDYLDAR